VLQAKIPARIRPLCLSLLGNDTESLRNLEASVQGILREIDAWNPDERSREIAEVTRHRQASLCELAELRQQERAIREAETVQQHIPKTSYSGTAQAIAQRLEREADGFAWLHDDPQGPTDPPLTAQELNELASLWADCDMTLLDFALPDAERLPQPDEFERAVERCHSAERMVAQYGTRSEDARVGGLSRLSDADLSTLQSTATRFASLLASLTKRPEAWVKDAVGDILSGNLLTWRSLSACTEQALTRLRTASEATEPTDFRLPCGVTQEQMLWDARALFAHLNSKKGLGFLCFRPAVAKRTRYLWKSYRFAGQLCDNVGTLGRLVTYLDRLSLLSKTWREWSAFAEPGEGGFRHSLAKLEECQLLLKNALELHDLAARAEADLSRRGIAAGQPIGADWADGLRNDIEAACAVRERSAAQADLERISRPILEAGSVPNVHPAAAQLPVAAKGQDPTAYRGAILAVRGLSERRDDAQRCCDLDQRLREAAPLLAEALRNPDQHAALLPHLDSFAKAWEWKLAKQWVERCGCKADAEAVATQVRAVEGQIADSTEHLVGLLAWQSCHRDLNGDFQKQGALQAWQLIVRRIGKGTGKHVETLRRDARKYMDECKAAIPAWIMPLHRVAETVEVHGGAFDVVIIDEASQTGPEGLMLQYLGKQCIVVGDDKQISPEAVGVNMDNVRALMKKYLDDVPFAETLTPTSSLFDQVIVRHGGNRVMLREHFRCMPEIIRFSDDLCYHDTPLITLRQYPPQRLEPIMVRHVVDGYREGEADNVVNRPEAAAVVKTIIDCLNDPRYAGKSMGVICLQGHAQAQLIEQMLLDAVGPAPFEERQLVCGDPYSFQGDERDVVFLSMVAASEGNSRAGALVRESYRQRFNVAVSRAKDQMWLFHSILERELHPDCMRRRLLEYCYHPRAQVLPQDLSLCESDFERDVATELVRLDYRVIPQYPAADKRIDLVVEGTKSRLAVECDGDEWHGPDRYEADMARQRMLERCGWKFVRIRGSSFYANRQQEIALVVEQLDALGIKPVGNSIDEGAKPWIEDICGRQCAETLRSPGSSRDSEVLPATEAKASVTSDSSGVLESAAAVQSEAAALDSAAENSQSDMAPAVADASQHGVAGPIALSPETSDAEQVAVSTGEGTDSPEALSEDDRIIQAVVACGETMWLRMSRWGKVNDTLTPRERHFVYDVGRRIREGRPPTIRQARWAAKIIQQAIELGFDVDATE